MAINPRDVFNRNRSGITRGVLSQEQQPAAASAPEINSAYADSLSRYTPEQQAALSQALDAVAKSLNVATLSPEQVGAVLSKSSDFLKDIGQGRESVEARINRGLSSWVNLARTTGTEQRQEEFAGRVQEQIEEAMRSGRELSERQLAILEEQLNLSREEIKSLQASRQEALGLAKQEAASARTVQDELYRRAGLTPEYDESGTLIGLNPMSEEDMVSQMTPLQQQQYQLAKTTTQKQLDALAGKFDMDPALTKSLQDQEEQLKAVLAQKLGPNFMKSTAGIQAMNKFMEAKTRIEESARLSWIQTGQGLVSSALGTQIASEEAGRAPVAQAAGVGAGLRQVGITAPLAAGPIARQAGAGEVGGVLSTILAPTTQAGAGFEGFQNILAPRYAQTNYERQLGLIQAQAEAQDSGSPWSGVLTGLLGTAVGAGTGALLGPAAGLTAGQGAFAGVTGVLPR